MTRSEQLANALYAVAKADHYMVGIVEPITKDELDAAEQILIAEQNLQKPNNAAYRLYALALDMVAMERRRENRT